MCQPSSRATKCWPISIPISSQNFWASTRSIRNAVQSFPARGRGGPGGGPSELSKLLFPENGRVFYFARLVFSGLFFYEERRVRCDWRAELGFLFVGGKFYPHLHLSDCPGKKG